MASPRPEPKPRPAGPVKVAGDSEELPEIVIEVRDGNIVLISDDEEALDRIEARLQSLMAHMSPKTAWTIFYLRSADATEAALMIERLFPQSSVSATASSSWLSSLVCRAPRRNWSLGANPTPESNIESARLSEGAGSRRPWNSGFWVYRGVSFDALRRF